MYHVKIFDNKDTQNPIIKSETCKKRSYGVYWKIYFGGKMMSDNNVVGQGGWQIVSMMLASQTSRVFKFKVYITNGIISSLYTTISTRLTDVLIL